MKPEVQTYIAAIPAAARPKFDALRKTALQVFFDAEEVVSYGIVGYRYNKKRPVAFISGWKDHVAIYPVPVAESVKKLCEPLQKGKGTLWISLKGSLNTKDMARIFEALKKSREL